MDLYFEKVSLERQSEYNAYCALCLQRASDYSFINLWGWAEEYDLHWAWTEDLVWIKQFRPSVYYWAPVGAWDKADWKDLFQDYFPGSTRFVRIPEQLWTLWKEDDVVMTVEDSRGDWDYIYDRHELSDLKGKSFHKKKNLVNRFKKKHDYQYVDFTGEMIDQALDMQKEWCEWRDCESIESLSAENRVIHRILHAWDNLLNVSGGAIIIENSLAAYTIAEYIDEETLLIHFEKGNTDYQGVYQAINQMFLEHANRGCRLVNRMQDLNNEGLRKAKLSYRPVHFVKKYSISLT